MVYGLVTVFIKAALPVLPHTIQLVSFANELVWLQMAAPLAELLTANVQFINSGEEDILKMAPPKAAILPVVKQLIKLLCLFTIFFTIEKPIPVPEYCPFPCKRWKASNIFVACSFLKPIPLSVIFMAYYSRCFTAARYSISSHQYVHT